MAWRVQSLDCPQTLESVEKTSAREKSVLWKEFLSTLLIPFRNLNRHDRSLFLRPSDRAESLGSLLIQVPHQPFKILGRGREVKLLRHIP
jgi:hypothetical protein